MRLILSTILLLTSTSANASGPTVIFSSEKPVLLTQLQMGTYASEGGADRNSKLRVTFVFEGVFAEEYALANGVDVTSPVIVQVETTLSQNLFGHRMFPMGMSSRVLPITKIEVLPPQTVVYDDDLDMSKLEGNFNILWYGGAAALAGAVWACSQFLGG